MRGLKSDVALREKALFQQQCERWAPYMHTQEYIKNRKRLPKLATIIFAFINIYTRDAANQTSSERLTQCGKPDPRG